MSEDTIKKIEPVTKKQVDALMAMVPPISRMFCGLTEVDTSKGRGVLNGPGIRHCLWTRSGHRITVIISSDGGVIASKSNEPDDTREVLDADR